MNPNASIKLALNFRSANNRSDNYGLEYILTEIFALSTQTFTFRCFIDKVGTAKIKVLVLV